MISRKIMHSGNFTVPKEKRKFQMHAEVKIFLVYSLQTEKGFLQDRHCLIFLCILGC